MRILWMSLAILALAACKSQSVEPSEQVPAETMEAEAPAAAEQAPTAAAEAPAVADEAPTEPVEAAAPDEPAQNVASPDPDAPANVAKAPRNAKRTESGLAWTRLRKGKGKGRPGKFDPVTLHYTGWTPDGRRFDTSERYGGPITVRADHFIPGLSEGLKMMIPGEKRRFWVPAKLGYGQIGDIVDTAPRQPLGDLVFDVELVRFTKAPAPPAAPDEVGSIPADAVKSDSGLAWRVLEEGTGDEHPIDTGVVEMTFTVWTADGEVVDSSMLRSGVDTLGIARLVPGWTEGMKLMVPGERRMFWIPEELAYQGAPLRPSGMLVVDVALVSIRKDLHQIR